METKAQIFEAHRPLLEGIAYRMLGTLADAQDMVQDTWLKWENARLADIQNPRTWLVTVCSRLCLDLLKSARKRRETYVGTWLPEPYQDEQAINPALRTQLDDTVSVALMLALETLSPPERVAFLLHEVFAYPFEEIAVILGKTPAACRKLASRARLGVQQAKPRFQASPEEHQRLVRAFLQAAQAGELETLKTILAKSVELYSDGGGKVQAVPRVLEGAGPVARFFVGVWGGSGNRAFNPEIVPRWFNGVPGILIYDHGRLATALSLAVEGGVIHRIYALRNPDKLASFEQRATAITAPDSKLIGDNPRASG